MLTRRRAARVGVLAAGLALLLSGAMAALADDGGAECPPNQTTCDGWGEGGGRPPGDGGDEGDGNGGGGGGGGPCVRDGEVVDCYDELLGWFNPSDGCYYRVREPRPDGGPEGMTPYTRSCGAGGLGAGEPVWLEDPPPGFGAPPDPAELAYRALAQLDLRPPEIGIAPDPAVGPGLVGLPIWLWVPADPNPDDNASTWGPLTASESERGVTVNLKAVVGKIVWDMGDGRTETCTDKGTPYTRSGGPSPTCGYDEGYRASSRTRPGGKYTVTATTTWTVTWDAGGQQGTIDGVTRQSTTAIQIDELQVVTR